MKLELKTQKVFFRHPFIKLCMVLRNGNSASELLKKHPCKMYSANGPFQYK